LHQPPVEFIPLELTEDHRHCRALGAIQRERIGVSGGEPEGNMERDPISHQPAGFADPGVPSDFFMSCSLARRPASVVMCASTALMPARPRRLMAASTSLGVRGKGAYSPFISTTSAAGIT